MVLRLESSQISRYWNDIKETLKYNLLPAVDATEEAMNRILESMLAEDMQVWAFVDAVEGKEIVYALCITSFLITPGDLTINLLIYSLYGYRSVPQRIWEEGLEGLRKFAKSRGCYKIVAYTKVPRIIEIVKSLGGKADYSFIELEI